MTDLYNLTSYGIHDLPTMWGAAQSIVWFFSPMTLLAIFIISFIAMKQFETTRALPASLFITTIVSIIFFIQGWLLDSIMYGCMVALGASIVFIYLRNDYG